MTTSQANGITKDELGKKYPQFANKALSLNTVRQTLSSCGLDTSKRVYSSEEEEKFKAARRLLQDENKTYQEVAEHFKVDLESASSDSGDAFFVNQTTEATGSGDVAFELATSIAQQQAQMVVDLVPAMTAYHINLMMTDGTVSGKLRTLVDKMGKMPIGNTHTILMQGIEKLEMGHILPVTTTTKAKSSTTKSSSAKAKSSTNKASTVKASTESTPASSTTSTASSESKSNSAAKK